MAAAAVASGRKDGGEGLAVSFGRGRACCCGRGCVVVTGIQQQGCRNECSSAFLPMALVIVSAFVVLLILPNLCP